MLARLSHDGERDRSQPVLLALSTISAIRTPISPYPPAIGTLGGGRPEQVIASEFKETVSPRA